jgi:hypothetical protein
MSILFELEKPPIEHLEGFILLLKKVVSYKISSKFLTKNSNSRTRKKSPIGSINVGASMVGGMFAIAIMNY